MGGFCILMELALGGSTTNGATIQIIYMLQLR